MYSVHSTKRRFDKLRPCEPVGKNLKMLKITPEEIALGTITKQEINCVQNVSLTRRWIMKSQYPENCLTSRVFNHWIYTYNELIYFNPDITECTSVHKQ